MSEEIEKTRMKETQILRFKKHFEVNMESYKNSLQKKIQQTDERIQVKKQQEQKTLIEKYNYISMRREDNYEKVCRIEKIQDYLKEKKLEEIKTRMDKIQKLQ